jgi:hypothetical protein
MHSGYPLSTLLLLACLGCLAGLGPAGVAPAHASGVPYFTDIAEQAGLDFTHFNGSSGALYLPEIMGPGAALFDYDDDGDLDVYLVQGGRLAPDKQAPDGFEGGAEELAGDRLFRNDLTVGPDGAPHLRFTDVTRESGIRAFGYGMGVAAGDFDNDGWVDLYVTNFGPNQLWRNLGDGRFQEVTATAGLGDTGWSVSAAFLDYDGDGWLDLYVGDYVHLDLREHKPCEAPSSLPDYCTPLVYSARPDRLYRNRGDGSFEDVSGKTGIDTVHEPTLGVIVGDYNADGWLDIYVANDGKPNKLWFNTRDGSFREDAFFAGAAVNMAGAAEGSMGVIAGDLDNDGDQDLFMTHLTGETNTVYVNDGKGWFEDRSIASGLGGSSKAFTGFGTGWLDFDNDGWLDVFVANGEVSLLRGHADAADAYPLHQPNQLFRNQGGKGFAEVTADAGPAFRRAETSRGAAFGDVDNDGDTDILVANNAGPARLLRNERGQSASWLGLRLVDRSGRDALGARVELRTDERVLWRTARSDGSYASASDPRVLFGLGPREGAAVREVRVYWPDGHIERWTGLLRGRYQTIRYGRGRAVDGDAKD